MWALAAGCRSGLALRRALAFNGPAMSLTAPKARPKLIDSHCHLADPRIADQVEQILQKSIQLGWDFFLQAGVDPEDWQRQMDLKNKYPKHLGLCFGLHPYFVSAHSEQDCENALDILAKKLSQALALGETGLDFRPQWLQDSEERQIRFFEQQLELAQMAAKPVILHIVRAHKEALQVIDHWGPPQSSRPWGMVHSFNGSTAQAEQYVERNLLISVGSSLLREDNTRLKQCVHELGLEHMLLESDSPDQAVDFWPAEWNEPRSVIWVAEEISRIKKLSVSEVLDKCAQNFENLIYGSRTNSAQQPF